MSDTELAKLRDALYCLAGAAVDGFQTIEPTADAGTSLGSLLKDSTEQEERAAIVKFDGGLSRDGAERLCGPYGAKMRRLSLVRNK